MKESADVLETRQEALSLVGMGEQEECGDDCQKDEEDRDGDDVPPSFAGKGKCRRRESVVFRLMGEYGAAAGWQGRVKDGGIFDEWLSNRLGSDDRRGGE